MIPSERKEALNFYHLIAFLLRHNNKLPRKLGSALGLHLYHILRSECEYHDNTRLQIVALLILWDKQHSLESVFFKKWKIYESLKTIDIDKDILFEVSQA